MSAALALGGIGALVALALWLARRLLAPMAADNEDTLVDAVDALLPQTQCGQCGHPGCRPYAQAVVAEAPLDLCPPGGPDTAAALRQLLGRGEERDALAKPAAAVARIDPARCIGCALCLDACPVDAIAGAARYLHAIIPEHCTGCELCVPACPVDCIDMTHVQDRSSEPGGHG